MTTEREPWGQHLKGVRQQEFAAMKLFVVLASAVVVDTTTVWDLLGSVEVVCPVALLLINVTTSP